MLSLEYVAGLFDGDGCIRVETPGVTKDGKFSPSAAFRAFPSYSLFAQINNTYEPIIRVLHEQFGGRYYRNDYHTRVHRLNRTIYEWRVRNRAAHAFLIAVKPFLVIKRIEAEWAITLQEHIDEFRHEMASANFDRRVEIAAYRSSIADRIRELKKMEHDFPPVENGAKRN